MKVDKTSKTKLYNRLKFLRAERRLSRLDLANAIGVNPQTIGYLERGEYNPSLELAFRLSEFFDLPIEAIFSPQPFKLLSQEIYASSQAARRQDKESEAFPPD